MIKRYWAKTNDSFIQCEYIFIFIMFWFSFQGDTGRQYHYTGRQYNYTDRCWFLIFSRQMYDREVVYDTLAISNLLLIMCYYSRKSSKHGASLQFLSLLKTYYLVPFLSSTALGWEFKVAVGSLLSYIIDVLCDLSEHFCLLLSVIEHI